MFKEKLSKILIRIFYIIFALIVSVALWMYVEITENEEQTGLVPIPQESIVFRNEDVLRSKGLLISSIETGSLSINFAGSRSDISSLFAPGALTVEIDLANVNSPGTVFLSYDIIYPQGVSRNDVEILGMSDSRITLIIDRLLERPIQVIANYNGGTASEEFMVEAVEYDPQTITVWGPEEVVSQISYVRVPILIENLASTYTDDLEFILYDENDEELDLDLRESLEFSQETIRVTIPIREIKDVPLTVTLSHGVSTTDANTVVRITPTTIKVAGDPEVIRDINNIPLGTIDMLSFGLANTESRAIIIPNHITNISGETEALVHIDVLGLEIAHRSALNLYVSNTPPGHRAEVLTQSLDIRLRGVSEDLDLITPLNIRIVADIADQSPGTTRVTARVYIEGVEVVVDPIGEYEITVTIQLE